MNILFVDIGGYIMTIMLVVIGGYSINGYWWSNYHRLLVVILL
jgi:hypothetical protein